jgi:3',5'-cyclic AMP phosphodiesterase CpdA
MRRVWLDELMAEVARLEPDRLLITGDLTQIGTREEIEEAREWLVSLGSPERITFVPGNHDLYARDSALAVGELWAEYLPDGGAFPSVYSESGVTIIGLSSALPTRPLSACGHLGETQLESLTAALSAHPHEFRLVLLHHPPFPGMIKFRKRLRDAAALAEVLDRLPADLVLHGHQHRNLSARRGATRIFCTAPASAEAASFRVFDIHPEGHARGGSTSVHMTLFSRSGEGVFEAREEADWLVPGSAGPAETHHGE